MKSIIVMLERKTIQTKNTVCASVYCSVYAVKGKINDHFIKIAAFSHLHFRRVSAGHHLCLGSRTLLSSISSAEDL